MSVQGNLYIYRYNPKGCIYDNGTEVCDKNHKLKFVGGCVSQSVGVFNSTDSTFQPGFLVCTSDYESLVATSLETLNIFGGVERIEKIYKKLDNKDTTQNITTYSDAAVKIYKLIIESYLKEPVYYTCLNIENYIDSNRTNTIFPLSLLVNFLLLQIDLQENSFQEFSYSDLVNYSVFGEKSIFIDYGVTINSNNSYILSIGEVLNSFSQIVSDTNWYTSNPSYVGGVLQENPYSICVGDLHPPFFSYLSPVSGTNLLEPLFEIEAGITDLAGGVDLNTLSISASGVVSSISPRILIADGEVVDSDADLVGTSSNYLFTYQPTDGWEENEDVYLFVSVADLLPINAETGESFTCGTGEVNSVDYIIPYKIRNKADLSCSLTVLADEEPPYIFNETPVKFSSNNAATNPIVFDVIDSLTGVNKNSLIVKVNSTTIINYGIPLFNYVTLVEVSGGYHIEYIPPTPFEYGDRVFVYVYAEDLYTASVNTLDFEWYYDIIISGTVEINNFIPEKGTTKITEDLNLSVDVIDRNYGINEVNTYFGIDGISIPTLKTPVYGLQHLTQDPSDSFIEDLVVSGTYSTGFVAESVELLGSTILQGTIVSGIMQGGSAFGFTDPFATIYSGTINSFEAYSGNISHGIVQTTLISGINWDGNTTNSTISGVSVFGLNAHGCGVKNSTISGIIGYNLEGQDDSWKVQDHVVNVFVRNNNTESTVELQRDYPLYYGYRLATYELTHENDSTIDVFYGGLNNKREYSEKFFNFNFNTLPIQKEELTAQIVGVKKDNDLLAEINPIAPVHRYGDIVDIELYVEDLQGNNYTFEFSYKIVDRN